MSTNSKIEWTDTTWNPIAGCTPVSAGCRNCYAANHARRLAGNPNEKVRAAYEGTARTAGDGRAVFTGRVNLLPERLEQPLRWRKPRRVFVNAMSDLFHEAVPLDFVDQVFAVMALAPQHTFQVLTKRPELMTDYLSSRGSITLDYHHPVQQVIERWIHERPTPEDAGLWSWPLPNVWLGTSVEDQDAADERIPHLLRCPAAVRFLSCEPLLGDLDIRRWLGGVDIVREHRTHGQVVSRPRDGIDWVIAGGESGPGARPCDVTWIRSLVDQCRAPGVPAFVKQLGRSWYEEMALVEARDAKGGDPSEWPEDLRLREFPEVTRG